jgi:hypothetical protein
MTLPTKNELPSSPHISARTRETLDCLTCLSSLPPLYGIAMTIIVHTRGMSTKFWLD